MDQMINEQPETVRERPARKKTFKLQIGGLKAEIGRNVAWYWDIRLWAPVLLVLFILALLPGKKTEVPVAEPAPTEVLEVIPVETEPAATEAAPVPTAKDPEAEALARLADTVGAGRTDRVKKVIMWVAINRSEDRANGFGKSLEEEIARPNQWQFYDESAPYGEGSYMMAQEILKIVRTNDLRPVDGDMLWLVLNDDGSVVIRNAFNFNSKTKQKTFK